MADQIPPDESAMLAFILGELDPEARRRVEEQLKGNPGQWDRLRVLTDEFDRWAREPVAYTPFRLESLSPAPRGPSKMGWRRRAGSWFGRPRIRLAWALAGASALLLMLLSQADVSVQWGGLRLAWGQGAATLSETEKLRAELASLAAGIAELEQAARANDGRIEEVALAGQWGRYLLGEELRRATLHLATLQEQESRTRYYDFAQLLAWTGYEPGEWTANTAASREPANN